MKTLINIADQSTILPNKLGGIDNPNETTLLANGWRWADDATIPALAEGVTRSPISWADSGDGVNAVAVYTDRPTANITAEQYAADLAANGTRYALQNQYMALCGQLTGQAPCKLGFAELQAIVEGMMATDPNTAMGLSVRLLTLNAALVREGGVQWWDNCVFTEGIP